MNRREFGKELLTILSSALFIETLFREQLLARPLREPATKWLNELHTLCLDLKLGSLSPTTWQQQIDAFHTALPLEELLKTIDFDLHKERLYCPDLGVGTVDPRLPKIGGLERYAFYGRIFGMRKDRAVIPHGHKYMVSCHRVLSGEFLLRQYDRIEDAQETMVIRHTIEEVGKPGSFSSISDEKNNVHWLIATTNRAYTFDVIVPGLENKKTEIDNIDIASGQKLADGDLRVRKLSVDEALKKYGKSHH